MNNGYSNSRVLITGGLGFIGSNLAIRLVAEGAQVTLLDGLIPGSGANPHNIEPVRDAVDVHICDLRDRDAVAPHLNGKTHLFNLAGQTSHLDSMRDPMTDLDINARAQLSLLEAIREQAPTLRVLFASTRQIYGRPQSLPVSEAHPVSPVDVNGINKYAGEAYHLLYQQVHGIPTTVLRLTNTYGPRMRIRDARQTFLGIWIKRLLEGDPIIVYGDGEQLRDLTYIDDCVDAMLMTMACDSTIGQVYNVGGCAPVSLAQLASMLSEQVPGARIEQRPFPDDLKAIDVGNYYSDAGRMSTEVGFEPSTPLLEGLRRTLEFFAAHGPHYLDADA